MKRDMFLEHAPLLLGENFLENLCNLVFCNNAKFESFKKMGNSIDFYLAVTVPLAVFIYRCFIIYSYTEMEKISNILTTKLINLSGNINL